MPKSRFSLVNHFVVYGFLGFLFTIVSLDHFYSKQTSIKLISFGEQQNIASSKLLLNSLWSLDSFFESSDSMSVEQLQDSYRTHLRSLRRSSNALEH